jgi:phage gpG-like protein
MKRNFTQKSLTKTALEIQNTTSYFKFHQLGTSKMVKRQVLGFKPDFIRQIKELYEKYLSKHFR